MASEADPQAKVPQDGAGAGEEDPGAQARAEADLRAAQLAQDKRPPIRPKVAPPSENPPPAATVSIAEELGETKENGSRPRRRDATELDVLAARVEGMAVTMRDMARVALAAVLLAVVALVVGLYVLRTVRGAQSA